MADLIATTAHADNFWDTSSAGKLSSKTEMLAQFEGHQLREFGFEDLQVTVFQEMPQSRRGVVKAKV